VPRPKIKRPPERPCRSQAVWATSIGEREKAMATKVPSSIFSVSFVAMASGKKASCLVSLLQRPAKPSVSAARAELHLRYKDELPRGLASLEVAVGLGCLRQRVGAADANLKGVVADPGQYALGTPQELLARQGVPG
jgi:hypothetical protein